MDIERKEALLRIPIGIVCAIIAELWGALIVFIVIVNWFFTLFSAKRNKDLANFANIYINYIYKFSRYMTFNTNERPFPFNKLGKEMEKFDSKYQN